MRATVAAAIVTHVAICTPTSPVKFAESELNTVRSVNSGMFDLPMILRLMLQSMVIIRMPESSVLMRNLRWK